MNLSNIRHRGFSLIELMVTLAVLAILVAIAGPSIDQLARRARLEADTEKFQSALAFARSEALKRSTTVSIVPNAGGYPAGWRIITDDAAPNPNCNLDAGQGESLIRVQDPLSTTTTFIVGSSPSTTPASVDCDTPPNSVSACISFNGRGRGITTTGGQLGQSMCLRDSNNPTGLYRAITLNFEGQSFLAKVK